ncbi:MAG: Npt1/Npt2 family nucleotide transporter [Chlamydiales bacterium]|nr:Npt1/Npt2 family nucleotide transporter [Chlamydiales bacterium]
MHLFLIAFSVVFLLNVNHTILRTVRNTLAVADLGGGAHTIPLFELFGALPASILMTLLLCWMLRHYSLRRVFLITVSTFLAFFSAFTWLIYPIVSKEQTWISIISSMTFYVMAELWKPAVVGVLFWGAINQYIAVELAKRYYAPLMLGSSLGALSAGPIVMACTSSSNVWSNSLSTMTLLIVVIGLLAFGLFAIMWRLLSNHRNTLKPEGSSLSECLQLCMRSPPLRLLTWLVLADYLVYSLGEVIFMEILREANPSPVNYCHYMGILSFWSSALTTIFALTAAPLMLSRWPWIYSALVLPIGLLMVEAAFFLFLRVENFAAYLGWSHGEWIAIVTLLGSIHYCAGRAMKYTFFDASKELAFVLIPPEQRMDGKLIIDGICTRAGRGVASGISLSLIVLFGGVIASAPIAGIVSISTILSWIWSTKALANRLATKTSTPLNKSIW